MTRRFAPDSTSSAPLARLVIALDHEVEQRLASFGTLSELTSGLALSYLERIRHPISSLTFESGVVLTTRGYLAHLAVEDDPARFGAGLEVPIIGTLPDFRKGRPPQDLLSRVVKATRRGFEQIRAVPDDVWSGYVLCVTGRLHAGGDDDTLLDSSVVDSLLRFGWVLRRSTCATGSLPAEVVARPLSDGGYARPCRPCRRAHGTGLRLSPAAPASGLLSCDVDALCRSVSGADRMCRHAARSVRNLEPLARTVHVGRGGGRRTAPGTAETAPDGSPGGPCCRARRRRALPFARGAGAGLCLSPAAPASGSAFRPRRRRRALPFARGAGVGPAGL